MPHCHTSPAFGDVPGRPLSPEVHVLEQVLRHQAGIGRTEPRTILRGGLCGGERGATMSGTITERIGRYILDGSDEDLKRLLRIAELNAEMARAAFGFVGAGDGWRALDCGCGPLGALPVMAEMVGSNGEVVGIDFTVSTVERAREVAQQLGLRNVEVIQADINE